MTSVISQTIEIDGLPTRVMRADASTGAKKPAAIFLHGGIPGVTPYCSGAHIWQDILAMSAAAGRTAIALDLPASGLTGRRDGAAVTVEIWKQHVLAAIGALELGPCHLVGHAEGGSAAMLAALNAPDLVRSVCLVASGATAPSGDRANDLTFAAPPEPRWGRLSQAWALEQVSYGHSHIDAQLLDACEEAAKAQIERRNRPIQEYEFGLSKAKTQLWVACRDGGVNVPTQMIWGTHDPLTGVEQGMALYQVVASRQRIADFHLVNRAGSLLFREEPKVFHNLVAAFHESLE